MPTTLSFCFYGGGGYNEKNDVGLNFTSVPNILLESCFVCIESTWYLIVYNIYNIYSVVIKTIQKAVLDMSEITMQIQHVISATLHCLQAASIILATSLEISVHHCMDFLNFFLSTGTGNCFDVFMT